MDPPFATCEGIGARVNALDTGKELNYVAQRWRQHEGGGCSTVSDFPANLEQGHLAQNCVCLQELQQLWSITLRSCKQLWFRTLQTSEDQKLKRGACCN